VALHIYRVKVRGRFAEVDDELAAALRADVAGGEPLPAFTPEGTFSYGPALTFFTFRFQLRATADTPVEAEEAARAEALERAAAALAARGIPARDVSVSAFDMADTWA
jgi:hypothetical protein